MPIPNFFIIGAAKAGTSSMYRYLDQHPDIYFPDIKEPDFFAFEGMDINFRGPGDENLNRTVITSWEEYLSLFENVTCETAIGEASVIYLYDKHAPEAIYRRIPDAKIIVILRNPIDRAFSSYCHLRQDGREKIDDFYEALHLEEERKAANWQHLWQYRAMSYYSEALKKYKSLFGVNMLVLTYDEFQSKPHNVLRNVYSFLGVDEKFQPDVSTKYNVSGTPKSNFIHQIVRNDSRPKRAFKKVIPGALRASIRELVRKNNMSLEKPEFSLRAKEFLRSSFEKDIAETEKVIGKDLSGWLNPEK